MKELSCCLAFFLVLIAFNGAEAGKRNDYTGMQLYVDTKTPQNDQDLEGMFAFTRGSFYQRLLARMEVMDGFFKYASIPSHYKLGEGVTGIQLIMVYRVWAEKNPKELNQPAGVCVYKAFLEAYPPKIIQLPQQN